MERKHKSRARRNKDPETWGIKPHWNIPQDLIDRAVKIRGFSIHCVYKAASRHLERYVWGLEHPNPYTFSRKGLEKLVVSFREVSIPMLIQMAYEDWERGQEFSAMLNTGQTIEYCIVADRLERLVKK